MRLSEDRPHDLSHFDHRVPVPELRLQFYFCITKLANVEVFAIVKLGPTEENVAGRLDDALSLNHSLPAILESALACIRLEHRLARFFHLQEKRLVIRREHEDDDACRADAADTDNFNCRVDKT